MRFPTRPRRPSAGRNPAILPGLLAGDPVADVVQAYVHNLVVGTGIIDHGDTYCHSIATCDALIELTRGVAGKPYEAREEALVSMRRGLRAYMRKAGKQPRRPGRAAAPVGDNVDTLAKLVGLDDVEAAVLLFTLAPQLSRKLTEVLGLYDDISGRELSALVAVATASPEEAVARALAPAGRLLTSGLVTIDADLVAMPMKLQSKHGLLDLVLMPGLDRARLVGRFLPAAAPPTLDVPDFQVQRDAIAIAQELLAQALVRGERGVNILLHGPTGTGKTELARLLAARLGTTLFVVGGDDSDGAPAKADERLASLRLGHQLVGASGALLLFDELEDLFTWEYAGLFGGKVAAARMSKQWFNDLLENNPAPTIWITNEARGVDPAFLRRFKFAIEMAAPGVRQRARILARHLGDGSGVGDDDVQAIAARFSGASPAQLGGAVAAARLVAADGRPDRATLEKVLAPLEKLTTGKDPLRRTVFDARGYRLDALCSSDDLVGIADRVAHWKPGGGLGLSLCLYGPPGTGKSEYVRYLAHRMGRPILYRRASDLLSMWVGGSEKNIAEAFREAEADDAVLLLDEVDSLLRDRRYADHSWEVTQVNELLSALETFTGVVACTTNAWKDLDEASVRRFVFKVEFKYMGAEQAVTLMQSMFEGLAGAPFGVDELAHARATFARIVNLAAGDFAVVARRVRALGASVTAAEVVALVETEARAKRGPARTAGF